MSGKKHKLLGVPSLGRGSLKKNYGQTVCNRVMEELQKWKCVNSIKEMVFDTTPTNTGVHTGACVTFQKSLGKPIFWLACRHHVLEIILSKVFCSLGIEKSTTPEIEIFKKFKDNWGNIRNHNDGNFVYLEVTPEVRQKYQNLKFSGLRDDYRELVNLALIYTKIQSSLGFTPQRPGAVSRARWMSKVIYSLKIVLLSHQNSVKSIFDTTCLNKLKCFVDFCINCYIPYWINCTVASAAPGNDLDLIKTLQSYKSTDEKCANSALSAINRHLWYLVEELVPLSLFDDGTSRSVKAKVAEALNQQINQERPKTFRKKNEIPKRPVLSNNKRDLADFVGSNSMLFF